MQLQCIHYNVKQISSFIYAFEGEIYAKLRNIHVGKPPCISPFCLFVKTLTYLRSTFLKKKKVRQTFVTISTCAGSYKRNKMKNYRVLVARGMNIDPNILNSFLEFPNRNSMLTIA